MKIKSILMTLAFAPIFGQTVNAEASKVGIFVEPIISYEVGTAAVDFPAPFTPSSGSAEGLGLGAKLGMHFSEVFFVAVDGRFSMPRYQDSSVLYDAKSYSTTWGPQIGVQMPDLGIRVWGTLVLDGELNPDQSGSFDVKFKKANGFRIGTGFRMAAVSLNIEYQQLKYGESTLEQIGPFSSGSTFDQVNLVNNSWIASVSFPLEL